ncbi:MAG TPA: biotin carboxylase N-terminal domain-containing protein, partial [Kofleriaceae bacterium]
MAVVGSGADAIRIVHAVRELAREDGIALRTIALHDGDHRAFHVREADEMVRVAPGRDGDLSALRDALVQARADALWSTAHGDRDAELAQLCEQLALTFATASPALVAKLAAPAALRALARDAGWPEETRAAQDGLWRRVAILVVADRAGHVQAPAISDVTLRRAGDAVLVECPVPGLAGETARALCDRARRLASRLGLIGVATVEALVAPDTGRFALAGLRAGPTGAQPIEATTGIDLIKLQLRLARGGMLGDEFSTPRGHAFAARVTCEDPERGFAASAG